MDQEETSEIRERANKKGWKTKKETYKERRY
jgi:hypothetical protein